MNFSFIRIATPLLAAFLCGCTAPPVYEGRLQWTGGWREGVVEEVGETDFLRRRLRQTCGIEALDAANGSIARIRWRQVGHARWSTVAVPQGIALKAGDAVFVNVASCKDAVQPRTRGVQLDAQ